MFAHGLTFSDDLSGDYGEGNEVFCHKMLKKGLKLDRVHTYADLSLSQLEEKITWVIEKTTGSPLSYDQL